MKTLTAEEAKAIVEKAKLNRKKYIEKQMPKIFRKIKRLAKQGEVRARIPTPDNHEDSIYIQKLLEAQGYKCYLYEVYNYISVYWETIE